MLTFFFDPASLLLFTLQLIYFYQSHDINTCELCGFVCLAFLALPVNHTLICLSVQGCQDCAYH